MEEKQDLKIERQKFQMHKKGYEDISTSIKESNKEISENLENISENLKESQKIKINISGDMAKYVGPKGDKGDKGDSPSEEELNSLIKPLIPKPIPGKDGDNYVITEKDKKDIAKSIKVPIVEKVIEKTETIVEKPIIKEVAKYESAEEIANKLDRVKKEWLSIDAIRGDFNTKIRQIVHTGGATGITEAPIDGKQYARKDANWSEVTATGSGDVVGPVSAIDSNFAAFDTTTGKLIKDSGHKHSDYAVALGINDNYVTDAQLIVIGNTSGTNTGDNASNTTSNSYADGKVEDAIVDGHTTVSPSGNAVFDALALKSPIASPTFTGIVTLPTGTNTVAPLKMVAGTNLTAPVAGVFEFDGTSLFFSI